MRLRGLRRRPVAFTMVGAVGICVGFSLLVECRLPSDSIQTSRNLQASRVDEHTEPKVCQAKSTSGGEAKSGGGAEGHLQLAATEGVPLKFKCDVDLSLKPENANRVFKVRGDKTCESSGEGVELAAELMGATLTKDGKTQSSRNKESQVYVFSYTQAPQEEKHLCYTCVSTTPTDSGPNAEDSQNLQHGKAGTETVKCTVYITVPQKKQEPATSSSSTPAPDSPSGARPVPAAMATAAGGLLAVMMLRL